MGELTNTYFKCKNMVANTECGMVLEVPINLLEVPIINKDREKKITFTDKVGVIMKYPPFSVIDKIAKNKDEAESEFVIVANSIDKIFDQNDVHDAANATQDELLEFVENLPQEKYELMQDFVENAPRSKLEIKTKCSKCGFDHELVLEGLSDFFI